MLEVAYVCSSNKPLLRQLAEQRSPFFQIERVEAFSETSADGSEQFASLLQLTSVNLCA
jgi:hypothetical protein